MASLTKGDLEDFIRVVSEMRNAAYEQFLGHGGAIRAAEALIKKLEEDEAKSSEDTKEGGGDYSPPSVSLPISGE